MEQHEYNGSQLDKVTLQNDKCYVLTQWSHYINNTACMCMYVREEMNRKVSSLQQFDNVTVILKICICKSNSCITSFRKSHSTTMPSILRYAWAHFYNFNLNKTYENVAKVVELFKQTDLSLCNLVHEVAISSVSCYSILTCELNRWQTVKICDPSLPYKHMQHCASAYQELQENFT